MNDFNIIIGVNLANAESKIKDMITDIGNDYPIKLKAVISNEAEFLKDIQKVAKLLKNLEAFDIDLNMGTAPKTLKEMESTANRLGKDMSKVSDETKEYADNLDSATKAQDRLNKLIHKKDTRGKGKETVTQKTGNDFISTTEQFDINNMVVPEVKEVIADYKKLDTFTNKVREATEKWVRVLAKSPNEISKLISGLDNLKNLAKNDPIGFEKELNRVQQLSQKLNKMEQDLVEKEKIASAIQKEKLTWQTKINDLERQGYTHASQMKSLRDKLSGLNEKDLKTMGDVNAQLSKMNQQYAKAVEYQKNKKFGEQRNENAHKLTAKVDSNLDGNLIGEASLTKIKSEISKIFETDSVRALEKAVRDVVNLYGVLINKQKEAIQQKKLEAVAEQDMEKVRKHLGEMEKKTADEQARLANEAMEHKAKQKAQELSDWESYYNEREAKEKEAHQRATKEANEDHERRVKQHEDEKKLAEQMNDGRAKGDKSRRTTEMKEELEEAKKFNKEQDRIYENQVRINKEYNEFDKVMGILRNSKFINQADLYKATELIDNLSAESKSLANDLSKVHNELQKVGREANNRSKKQDTVNVTNTKNQNQADEMFGRGVVPKDLINNFKQLSESLSFESSLDEIQQVKLELAKLVKLEADLNNESKNTVKYEQLIAQAKQDSVKVTDKYKERLEEISHIANRQINSSELVADVETEIARVLTKVNEHRERGVHLTHSEQQEIQKQIKAVSRLVQAHRDVEQEQNRIDRSTQQLSDRFYSMSYRATRGFDKFPRQAREINEMINEIQSKMDSVKGLRGDDFTNEYREIEKMMTNMNRRSQEIRDNIRTSQNSFFGKFSHAMGQVPVWISAMTLFYGSMQQIQQGFQDLLDVDKAMINLQKVTEATSAELDEFKNTASEIGHELGVVSTDIINATTSFQKLGYTLQESTTLGKNSILYANVGDMNVEDATQNIISTVKGFNVEVDKSGNNVRKLVDIFNEVSNNFAISSAGIGEALKRSSAVLSDAGNSIEQSVALVTSANTTIQDPHKVGNALKTISMRLRGVDDDGSKVATLVPELERVFQSFGATIMEDENTFKSTYDIFDTLSSHWENLTDVQQAYITELVGGKEQGSIVASMLSNWNDALESHEFALNSAGSAEREFQNYMEGFEYKIGQLKNALEEFWVTLMNDGAFKGFIDFLTSVVEGLTSIVEIVGGGQIGMNLIGLFAVLSTPVLRETIFDIEKWRQIRGEIVSVGASGLEMGTRLEKGAKGIGRAIALIGGRLLWVVGAVSALTFVMQKAWEMAHADEIARKERLTTLEDEIKQYERLQETAKNINLSEYLSLDAKKNDTGLNTEEYQKYAQIQSQIIDNMPELIAYYDEHGNAILRDSETIKQLLADKEKMYQQDKKEKFELGVEDADFDNLQEKISDVKNAISKSENSVEEENALVFVRDWISKNKEELDKGGDEIGDKLGELYQEFTSRLSKDNPMKALSEQNFVNNVTTEIGRNGNVDSAMKYIDDQIKMVRERTSNLNSAVDRAKADVNSHIDEFSTLLEDGFATALYDKGIQRNSDEFLFINQLKEQLKTDITELGDKDVKEQMLTQIPEYIDQALAELEDSSIDVTELIKPSANADEIKANFDKVISSFDNGTDFGNSMIRMLQRMKEEQLRTSLSMAQNPIQPFSFAQDVQPLVNNYMDGISELDGAYRSLNEGNALTISQTFDLIEKYPQLSKELVNHNGTITLSKKAIMELAKAKEAEFKTDLQAKKVQAKNAQDKAKAVIKAILAEAKALQFLGEINAKTIKASMKTMDAQAKQQADHARTARNMGEDGVARQISEQRQNIVNNKNAIEEQYGIYVDMENEINKINALLNMDFSSNLGSITGSTKDKKDKKKDEVQDAIYVADKYKQTIDSLTTAISILQARQDRYSKTSTGYKKLIEDEIKVTNAKKKAIDSQIKSLEDQIKKQNIIQTGLIQVGKKDDNKTARAKRAEIQQEIDKAKENLNNLRVESEQTLNRIQELQMSLVQVSIDIYNKQRDMLSDDIAYAEYAMELYADGSKTYMTFANTKLSKLKEVLKYHQQEIQFLEKQRKTNKNLTDEQKANLDSLIIEAKKSAYDASKAIMDMQQAIDELNVTNATNKFNDEAENYADKIKDIRDKLKYDVDEEGDYAKKIDSLKQILALEKGQVADAKKNIAELEKLKTKYKGNHELVEKITDEIEKWKDSLKDSENGVKDLQQEIEKAYENVADEFVDIYKKQMELMKKAEDERYEAMIEAETKAHENRMEQIEDEMSQLRKIYDEKMKMIDREESTRTYDNDIDKMKDEAKELQEQINVLSLDDSYEAKAKKSELIKQLAEKNLEISEKQHQREIELRKDNLEDDLEKTEEQLQNKKDAYQDDFDKFNENEEKKRKEREKYWEQQMNDEKKFAEIRELVMKGSFDKLSEMLGGWSKDISGEMTYLGDTIANNFTTRIEEAIKALKELKDMDVGSIGDSNNVAPDNEDHDLPPISDGRDTGSIGESGYTPSKPKPKPTPKPQPKPDPKPTNQQKRYYTIKSGDTMGKLAVKYYGSSAKWTKIRDANPKVNPNNMKIGTKLLIPFRSGGYTGDWSGDGGRLAVLHKKELVLNKEQTKDILNTAKIVDKLKTMIPNLSVASSVNTVGNSEQQTSTHNEYNVNVHVESMNGDKKSADVVADQIMTKIKRTKGGRF